MEKIQILIPSNDILVLLYSRLKWIIIFSPLLGLLFVFSDVETNFIDSFVKFYLVSLAIVIIIAFFFKDFRKLGSIYFDSEGITIPHLNTRINHEDIETFGYHIDGYRFQLRGENYRFLNISNGTNNYLSIKLKNNRMVKIHFYLSSKEQKREVESMLIKLSSSYSVPIQTP